MGNLLAKPKDLVREAPIARYEKLNLVENPFPSEPVVNKDSEDKRVNGDIFEIAIRDKEYKKIVDTFIKPPIKEPSHLRMGYILDTSYIGRGNGKSAFLLYIHNKINSKYCLDYTENNKCFSVYISPEPGGRTKTFGSFIDNIFKSILNTSIIDSCLAALRFKELEILYPEIADNLAKLDDKDIIMNLNNISWYNEKGINISEIQESMWLSDQLEMLPSDFPIFTGRMTFMPKLITQDIFMLYYTNHLKRLQDKIEFLFTHMVLFFQSVNFNGAYLLVDDFERIPDFQSARQKKDFALELRQILYDGSSLSARYGFYIMLLVLHAGVPSLIEEAWAASGMEHRSPISYRPNQTHIIPFEKMNAKNAKLLLSKYLNEYRIKLKKQNDILPFNTSSIKKIGEVSEYNAAKMLKMAYTLMEKVADEEDQNIIDEDFIIRIIESEGEYLESEEPGIQHSESIDLRRKAGKDR